MIDEKKIWNYIKEQINPYGKPFTGTAYEFGLKVMDYIEDMEKVDEWIPCSKRLPPQPDDTELLKIKCLKPYLVSVQDSDYPYRAFWNGKYFSDGYIKFENVIAWMPLPEPYRPGKEINHDNR
ncbi:MAG: DUF551 domain-containing protein [Lachnospiraceae bacterium]